MGQRQLSVGPLEETAGERPGEGARGGGMIRIAKRVRPAPLKQRRRKMWEDRRISCLGCHASPLPDPFLDLGPLPLANGLLPPGSTIQAPRYPLAVAFCPACYLVQLTFRVSPEELFSEYLYFSSFSDTLVEHARKMAADLTTRLDLKAPARVLEIASNDGYLLRNFQPLGFQVLGIEPAANIAEHARQQGIPTLNRFFGQGAVAEIVSGFGQADLIIGNNVLAHVPGINGFLSAVRMCLRPEGTAVFEVPYVRDLLDKTEFDTIYHEHAFYYSLSALRGLAERSGLELFDVEKQSIHGGSLRVFLRLAGRGRASLAVHDLLKREKAAGLLDGGTYAAFSRKVENLREELLAKLKGLREGNKRIAAYGAPAKGNILLNFCGVTRDMIEFTVDRSTHKQGRLLPGTRIPILKPEALLERMPDFTVILPWNITEEIVEQQKAYLEGGGNFIVPIPRLRVISGSSTETWN